MSTSSKEKESDELSCTVRSLVMVRATSCQREGIKCIFISENCPTILFCPTQLFVLRFYFVLQLFVPRFNFVLQLFILRFYFVLPGDFRAKDVYVTES